MSISLTAKQQTISEIFSENWQYIIPSYQRPYSWDIQECEQLWEDLINVFENDEKDYFIGNIILAKGLNNLEKLEVVDGQQRLITISLIIKALSLHLPDINRLKQKLEIFDEFENKHIRRLYTQIFENDDAKNLDEIMNFKNVDFLTAVYPFIIDDKDRNNRFKINFYFFYFMLNNYQRKREFAKYFLEKITLLPIMTEDPEQNGAREKALIIFETINNRGLDLSDTDIFKAKLYSLALNVREEENFINRWVIISEKSENLSAILKSKKGPLLDIFRIYSHIIRGRNKITKSEIGLREFFSQNDSPFKKSNYSQILDDIEKIIQSIVFFQDCLDGLYDYKELTKLFQIIKEYPNQYPVWALFVYIFNYGFSNLPKLESFVKYLIKLSLIRGLYGNIKNDIYKLIVEINTYNEYDQFEDLTIREIDKMYIEKQWFGLLRKSYSLLAFYLNEKQELVIDYRFDKLVQSMDMMHFGEEWQDLYSTIDYLGNIIILDIPMRRIPFIDKIQKVYSKSNTEEIKNGLLYELQNWNKDKFILRNQVLVDRIINFFMS